MTEKTTPTVDEARAAWVASGGKASEFNLLVRQLETRAAIKEQERIIEGLNNIQKQKLELFGPYSRHLLVNIPTLVSEIETGFTG